MNQESTEIILNLPLPPSLNDYYGHTSPTAHRVIKYVKTKGKNFRNEVKKYVLTNDLALQINVPIKVEIILSFPTNRKQDIDNRMKSLLDSLTYAEVWEDDSLIYELHAIKTITPNEPYCIVKISEY